jgi:hypothetical protein
MPDPQERWVSPDNIGTPQALLDDTTCESGDDVERFTRIFDREPTAADLHRYRLSRNSLFMRLPPRTTKLRT